MSESTEEKKKSGQGIRDCIYYIVNVLDWMGELCSVSNETSSGSEDRGKDTVWSRGFSA